MKTALTAVIVAVLILATSASASFVATGKHSESSTIHPAGLSAGQPRVSWADAKHRYGWVGGGSPQRPHCPRAANVLCATEDGGKHWRPIFRGGSHIFSYLRWSKNAGVLSAGAYSHGELWTRDGGRHWWGTSAFWLGANEDMATGFGAGPRFVVGRGSGRQLRYAYSPRWPYRVLGWVPTRALKCAGEWARWSGETKGPRNICFRPVGGDRMSAVPAGPAARLTVTVDLETGDGLVHSYPRGIDCGTITPWNAPTRAATECTASFGKGSTVYLRRLTSVGAGPQVVQWTGCTRFDLRDQPYCVVELAEDSEVAATFRRNARASVAR